MVRNISPKPHQFSRVSAPHPVRYGVKSERFELRESDCGGSDCSAPRQRSEIAVGYDDRRNPKIGEDVWIGWSFYNQSATSTPFLQMTLGQWKINRDPGHPFVRLTGYNNAAEARTRRGNDDIFIQLDEMRALGPYQNGQSEYGNICSLFNLTEVRGRWTDIVINTNWGPDENGYLRVWVNDELKCDYRGQIAVSRHLDFGGAHHRRGIYWSETERWRQGRPMPTMVVYYDEYRVGPTREQVDIRLIEAAGGPAVD